MPAPSEPDPAPIPAQAGRADRPSAPAPFSAAAPDLARQLTGELPCISCRYDLRGLSVRSVCPECGTPVRATILAKVDPYARVLRPLVAPRATAAGLVLWALGGLIAAMLTWGLRLADTYATFTSTFPPRLNLAVLAATACLVLAALGAAALIRPHSGIPVWQSLAAAGGVLGLLLLALLYYRLHGIYDMRHTPPYVASEGAPAARSWMRLGMGALIVAVILALRPNARLLASRSLLLRMGRVDRQTMLAMTAVLAVAAVGDVLHLAALSGRGGRYHYLNTLGDFLIAVGSMLFTLGLAGVLVDCLRIAAVLRRPPLSIREIVSAAPAGGGA